MIITAGGEKSKYFFYGILWETLNKCFLRENRERKALFPCDFLRIRAERPKGNDDLISVSLEIDNKILYIIAGIRLFVV